MSSNRPDRIRNSAYYSVRQLPENVKRQARLKGKHLKQKVSENTVGRAQNALKIKKYQIKNSKPVQTYKKAKHQVSAAQDFGRNFKARKGIKSKAQFLGKSAWNHAKQYNAYKKATQLLKRMIKLVKNIIKNGKWIGLALAIITLFGNIIFYGMSLIHALGDSPHYYCSLNPSSAVKDSKAYQQYCNLNNASTFSLDEINGHYISQDGSGPCWCCSMANLYLRFFTRNNVNFYDYLWQEDGQYPIERQISASPCGNTLRTLFNHNSTGTNTRDDGSEKYTNKGIAAYGVLNFGKKFNLNVSMADWGYVRDSSLSFSGKEVGSIYQDLSGNSKWVWDLSAWNSFAPGSDWTVRIGTGDSITIENVTGTMYMCDTRGGSDGEWNSTEALKKLLDEHPSGVFAWREYTKPDGSTGHHALLITGYKDDVFYVVDSAKGLYGGFEGPSTDNNFCYQVAFNNEVLHRGGAKACGVLVYGYIKEDKP